MTTTKNKPLPFFTWVGGKRKLADQLIKYVPATFNNYYEPFLGGGALFFKIKDRCKQCFLSDINLELITSYNTVKKNPTLVSDLFAAHKEQHSKKYYYRVQKHNDSNDPTNITARFLYLNKYSFMGMYRVNKSGKLCLSFSSKKYNSANFDKKLQQCSSFLSDATIYVTDFSFIEPKENDFVYFDPPYYQTGERFYTRLPFDKKEQIRLKDFAKELTSKGVKLMISNSDSDFIRDIYQDFTINTVDIKYAITRQKKISKELVITNYASG
nr:Dam family site-specific DNA-(adenine-N6)-methyltransferase [Rickettsia endosymbiont of Oedothorax gibbosus]